MVALKVVYPEVQEGSLVLEVQAGSLVPADFLALADQVVPPVMMMDQLWRRLTECSIFFRRLSFSCLRILAVV